MYWIQGPTSIGKTPWVKAHEDTYLYVTHLDQLKSFDPKIHGAIIFDEMDFRHLPNDTQKKICEWDNDVHIHIRFTTAFIPRHTKKYAISNDTIFNMDDPAIKSRIIYEYVDRIGFCPGSLGGPSITLPGSDDLSPGDSPYDFSDDEPDFREIQRIKNEVYTTKFGN